MRKNNSNLHKARNEKNDEFYTRIEDIEKELKYYRKHFLGKVVFCNCDDPYESNFFKYFALNFNVLGLKKLIATCYDGSPIVGTEHPLWKDETDRTAWRAVITMDELVDANGDGAIDEDDVLLMLQKEGAVKKLEGNGSFDSPECLELLKESDIVCTNPPFSLFRKFVKTMMEYDKKFLIIGSMNAITYKDIFSYIKSNKLWCGMGFNMSLIYKSPYKNNLEANRKFVKSHKCNPDEYIKVPSCSWFTNLLHSKRTEPIESYKKYNSDLYPKYDNYDAIEVSKIGDIPEDYDGVMGVPITFLDKYCPDQFKIIGLSASAGYNKDIVGIDMTTDGDARPIINGEVKFARVFIKRL